MDLPLTTPARAGLPAEPPPEVLAAMRVAADGYAALRARGLEIAYAYDRPTRRVTLEVRNAAGEVSALGPSVAIALACGTPLVGEEVGDAG